MFMYAQFLYLPNTLRQRKINEYYHGDEPAG